MSFCPNCGTQCADNAAFCSGCGSSLSATPAWQQSAPVAEPAPVVEAPVWEQPAAPVVEAPVYQQPVWEQPAAPQPMYAQPAAPQPMYQPTSAPAAELPTVSKILGIISFACGIASLPMSLAYGSGLFLGIAAIILSSIANSKAAAVGAVNSKARTGKKLGIAGTIVGGIIFFIFVILIGALTGSVGSSSYYYY